MCSIIDSTRTEAHLAETCPLAGHHRPQHGIASGAVVTAAVAVCDLGLERHFQGFGLRNMTRQHGSGVCIADMLAAKCNVLRIQGLDTPIEHTLWRLSMMNKNARDHQQDCMCGYMMCFMSPKGARTLKNHCDCLRSMSSSHGVPARFAGQPTKNGRGPAAASCIAAAEPALLAAAACSTAIAVALSRARCAICTQPTDLQLMWKRQLLRHKHPSPKTQ